MTSKPKQIDTKPMHTPWTSDVDPHLPHPEYPRPQMVREQWQNLNGMWDYQVTRKSASPPEAFAGQILVPFPIESTLSGVRRQLHPDEELWYRRQFTVDPAWLPGRTLLHFGAVDWHCRVYVNGKYIGEHVGGYDPFSFDITDALIEDENTLLIWVSDPTDTQPIQRGKQVRKPGFIWYSAHSGIWQTVWLESVPQTYLESIRITPDIDQEWVTIEALIANHVQGCALHARVFDQGQQVAEGSSPGDKPLRLPMPDANLWSPDNPHLYDLELSLHIQDQEIDQVRSYFGMRKFSLARDSRGVLRFCLNNQPLFLYGPLDQGYWPDGLCTPPTDAAIQWEINFIKAAGFNMLRKHIKVESARYYYHCDQVGIIVWQDMVSGGISPKPIWFLFAQQFKALRDTHCYWRLGRSGQESRDQFKLEYQRMISALHNTVSIAIWCPFNEGWGQFDAADIAEWTKTVDPSRLVDHASGWFDQGAGDFKSEHIYFKPLPDPRPDPLRAWVLSEFGGYSLNLPEHAWNPRKDFGYKKFGDSRALTQGYVELLERQLIPWINAGLSAAVYTQTTDVETEVNGFLTYDRKMLKMDLQTIAAAHHRLMQASINSIEIENECDSSNHALDYNRQPRS
ncbi:MAG: glycoside hydrolase family 2 TIM barrel-domain containing protein [Chloroflexota bacterium]|nr:glycoside hydrolase family 2 TIM barrel-domain containing protein [Chloroflexota bacterium]